MVPATPNVTSIADPNTNSGTLRDALSSTGSLATFATTLTGSITGTSEIAISGSDTINLNGTAAVTIAGAPGIFSATAVDGIALQNGQLTLIGNDSTFAGSWTVSSGASLIGSAAALTASTISIAGLLEFTETGASGESFGGVLSGPSSGVIAKEGAQ